MNDEDDFALVTSWQRSVIDKLSRNPAAKKLDDVEYWKDHGVTFKIPKDFVSFRTTRRRLNLSPEQREARAERARKNGENM
jgi:hypothetical protein